MKLSVIIPVFNEERSAATLIDRVKSAPVHKEIIVVDDCSRDGTYNVLRSISGIELLRHDRNLGKGAAIRTGLARARGDIVVIQDADLEYDPNDYVRLLRPLQDPRVHAVYGSRFRGRGNFLLLSRLANYYLTFWANLLFGGRTTDMETCYKMIRRDTLGRLSLTANRFEIEPEITAKLMRHGCRISEVPITYLARREGKKIGARDGAMALYALWKWYVS